MGTLNVQGLVSSLRVLDGTELPPDYPDIGFFEIDRLVFADQYHVLSESELGSSRLSAQWFQRNPSIYTVLMSEEKVVGYCNVMPLRESAFESLKNGTLADGEITAEMIETFDCPGSYKVFCCGVAILEEYRCGGLALRMMLSALLRKFQALAKRGGRISEIAAVAWTGEGRALCEGLGLQLLCPHDAHGDVYCARLLDPTDTQRGAVLRRLAGVYKTQKLSS